MSSLPPVLVHHPHVEVRPDLFDGAPVVRGHRLPVRRLWYWHRQGVSVATLVKRYPMLGWAAVLDALSFAYDNEHLLAADNVCQVGEALRALEGDDEDVRSSPRGPQLSLLGSDAAARRRR